MGGSMLHILKKDDRVVPYYKENIINDLHSAQRVFDITLDNIDDIVDSITDTATAQAEDNIISSVELFTIVEEVLEHYNKPLLAAFREFKDQEHNVMMRATDPVHAIDAFEERDPMIMHENGNKDTGTFAGQREALIGAIYKAKSLSMYPEHVQKAHMKGLIHLHDLDRSPFSALPNCSLPDFEYLLSHGFQLGNAHIRPPQSVSVAANLIAHLFAAISGEQYGGISVHEIDKLLAPYVQKTHQKNITSFKHYIDDEAQLEEAARKLTEKDTYDAMQTLEYQVNTMSSSAAQVPFTTVSLGLGTSWEERLIQKSLLQVRKDGMDGNTALFPKILFWVEEGVNYNPNDPNYDMKQLAMECSRKRIYPDMVSAPQIRNLKDGDLITAMGCRSFLHPWRTKDGHPVIAGRNNLGVISINLPRIAIQSEGNTDLFFKKLQEAAHIVLDGLHVREDSVLSAPLSAAPIMYTQGGLGDPTGKTSVRDFYTGDNNKRSSISVGYIGIHNAMVALTGDINWQNNKDFVDLSKRILPVIQEVMDKRQDEFHGFVSMYATPSESLCDRFARCDTARFGVIPGVNDKGYYENSFHFPSDHDINPFGKIHFESDYMKDTTGGFMYYVEAPDLSGNPRAFEALWDEAYHNVGYFGVNTPSDVCFMCDYHGEFHCDEQGYVCPSCGNRDPEQASVIRRLCGYLGAPMKRPVVEGKNREINNRVKHL